MQLYHHPCSMDSQKVRLALEERDIDYTSYHVNPLTGKNMEVSFFRMNPSAKIPVFKNGSHIIYRTIDIIQYIDRLAVSLSGEVNVSGGEKVIEWMQKIDAWNPKMFTLSHIPDKYRNFVSKFVRRVIIARMAESPELASNYHEKLRDAYETEEKMRDLDTMQESEGKLIRLLDDAEMQLEETRYIAGDEFTLADTMFVPVLVRITLLNLEDEYINCRPKVKAYYQLVKHRNSYKVVIGKYFSGWRKHRTILKTLCFICVRSLFRAY
ncbi:putative glutathione transferase [Dioscorea sansibarensis]